MIKGIVFDLDHTLFDRYGTLRAVLPHMYKGLRHWINENISCEEFVEEVIEGDNPLNDVFASRNAGYIPVWVATTGTWIFGDLKRADYEIETIAEIPELVHKLNA